MPQQAGNRITAPPCAKSTRAPRNPSQREPKLHRRRVTSKRSFASWIFENKSDLLGDRGRLQCFIVNPEKQSGGHTYGCDYPPDAGWIVGDLAEMVDQKTSKRTPDE